MDDGLEKFIKSQRDQLDDRLPRKDLWADIEKELKVETKERRITSPMIYWRAAAVILLLITSWLAFDKVSQYTEDNSDVAEVNQQLLEAESFYVSLIAQKSNEISVLSAKYDLGGDFLNDIEMLDSMYTVLKKDLNNGNEENLVDAMILNLQLRIEILNQQLSIIQSIENSEEDETISL